MIAFYGTQRLWQVVKRTDRKAPTRRERLDGYIDCLDPRSSEGQLLAWMRHHARIDFQRVSRGEPPLGQLATVLSSLKLAAVDVKEVIFDFALDEPRVHFNDGTEAAWGALSDGYHVFLGLVADIARRAVILNDHLGANAPLLSGGVVLVDEIDLHLHPKWQRTVVQGLRKAFPKIQFVLTTHSPQVLGSVENRQVRRLKDHQIKSEPAHVHGRDSNAILDDEMGASSRSEEGEARRRALHTAIDEGHLDEATALLAELKAEWGELDPAVVYAETSLDWARTTPEDEDARDQEG
ncbi:MAG: AAA family ATPase [Myxococcales bacterium]|nr:AAA family ATPase [Myxococcales bacterium]